MSTIEYPVLLRPEHVVEFLAQYIEESQLGFKTINKYDEFNRQEYPAIQILAGLFTKELHATHTWAIGLKAEIYVMHAKMSEDRASRNLNDLILASETVEYLESDMTLGGRIIQGWVESEIPGVMPPRGSRSDAVVSTRLAWSGISQERFG